MAVAFALKILWLLYIFLVSNWEALLVVSIIGFLIYQSFAEKEQIRSLTLDDVDKLSPRGFEEYLSEFFKDKGYNVIVTPMSGDKGADLIVERSGVRTAIQAKHYKVSVDHKSVQEVYCSLKYYKCKRAIVITNSHFTKMAKVLGRSNKVELWDRERLGNELSNIKMIDSREKL